MILDTFNHTNPACLTGKAPLEAKFRGFRPKQATWSAFETGMQGLIHYSGQTCSDLASTASSNMRLLHNSLLGDSSYKGMIRSANKYLCGNNSCYSMKLFDSHLVEAKLIFLHKNNATTLINQKMNYDLLMLISGKAIIENNSSQSILINQYRKLDPRTFFKRYRGCDDVLLENDVIGLQGNNPVNGFIRAFKQDCIFLYVSLPKHGDNQKVTDVLHFDTNNLRKIA